MEAYRKIVELKNNTLKLILPDTIRKGKVEVIILPVEDEKKTVKRKPSDFRGAISPKAAAELRKHVEKTRNEWERDF